MRKVCIISWATTSALAVAEALAVGRDSVDVSQMLKDAQLTRATVSFCPGKYVFAARSTAQEAAQNHGKKASSYVELTHAAILPEYLPPEAVGSKTTLPGQDEVLAGYTEAISQLSQPLQAITTAPGCFRNLTQWVSAFCRYSVAAVSSEQVGWDWVNVHIQTVARVSLEYSPMVAILYDEVRRKSMGTPHGEKRGEP